MSHMGQVMLPPDAAEALEALVPMDVIGLGKGGSAMRSSPMMRAGCSTT
jgi:hypothetical protein